jgi:hypothetical protein
MAVTWDYSVLPFQSIEITRRNLSRSGGLTIFGTEQVVQSSSDFWAANVTLKVRKREQILAYRALQAQSYGRATEWLIPVPISAGIFAQTRFVVQNFPEASFSAEFSPEFMEENIRTTVTRIPYPHITGKVSGTAVNGATSLNFTMDDSGIRGGVHNDPWVPAWCVFLNRLPALSDRDCFQSWKYLHSDIRPKAQNYRQRKCTCRILTAEMPDAACTR